jgi:hypothetical protein
MAREQANRALVRLVAILGADGVADSDIAIPVLVGFADWFPEP